MEIDFPYTPDFNQTVTVNPDGYISLRNAGGVHVDGETVPEIKKDIKKAYANVLRNPEVSITLKQFQNPYFLALGQVTHPGKYDLRGATTVAEAVAMAGGFTSKGKRNDIVLFRRVSDNWVSATKVNLKHMLTSKNLAEDLQLHPGDMIYVPQNRLSKIKPFIKLPSSELLHPVKNVGRRHEDGTRKHRSIYEESDPCAARTQHGPGGSGYRVSEPSV